MSIAVNVFGGESGAHFNPAVTAGFLATGRITPDLAVAYIIAQLAGACAAALIYEHVLLRPMKPKVEEPRSMRA